MGLTVHYQLHCDTRDPAQVRKLVSRLRQAAMDLPLKTVSDVVGLSGEACDFANYEREHSLRWLVSQAARWVVQGNIHYTVVPRQIVAFTTLPGDGCEEANFGLALYPGVLKIKDPRTGRHRRLRTGIKGWRWQSFCKTQYASGIGIDHFVRCHLSVIRMLDHARELGILAEVKDEGGFWEKREIKALVEQVGQWNEQLAGLVGQLKDMFGGNIEAPITKFPDFEHLEARGRNKE